MTVSQTPMDVNAIYRRRFSLSLGSRDSMWRELCAGFFQRFIPEQSVVLEVGAGYCEFINNIVAARKIAVDVNPATGAYATPEVEVIQASSTDLTAVATASVDVAFASNFFEHLTREDIVLTMREVARVLRPGGRFLVLQPNIRYCARDFWMFFDHITPLDQHSLAEALEISGFHVVKTIVRFLPFTTKSRLPKAPWLIKLYLRVPLAWRVLGQQTFAVAEVAAEGRHP